MLKSTINAMDNVRKTYETIENVLEKATKRLELAEIDFDHSSWYIEELERHYLIYEDEATKEKLDKAYADYTIYHNRYNAIYDDCEKLKGMVETLKDIETELYYCFNDVDD